MVKFKFKLVPSGSLDKRDVSTRALIKKLKKLPLAERNIVMQDISKEFRKARSR